MNAYAIPPILAGLLNVAMAVWVYRKASSQRIKWTFILWNTSLAFWNFSIAVGYVLKTPEASFTWYHWTIPLAISFISPFFLHFVVALTGASERLANVMVRIGYAFGFVFLGVGTLTYFLIRPGPSYFWGTYPSAGPGAFLFGAVLYVLAGYAFFLLVREIRHSTGHRRNQLEYVFAGAAIVFGAGFTNFLPLFGVSVYPVGNLMNSLYSLMVAYAIIEYGLMDISVILRRGTVYGMLSGGLTVVYLSLVAVLQHLFGHYGIQENLVFYTAAFPVTVILAPTMKTRIEPWVDRTFFRKSVYAQVSLQENKEVAFMGILATEMVHELTKPLTHIMNEGARLEQTVKGAARESLTRIGKEVQRATEILDGFVLLSPDRPLHRMFISLAELLEEALASLGIENDRSIKIVKRFTEIPPTLVNPGQMVQVFTNLIQNAWQSMPEGGVLTLSLHALTHGEGAGQVEIAIADTGRGIPSDLQSKIFEPFYTTKKSRGGHGVGLTLCRAIIERHGGQICIESPLTPAGGTRVVVHLSTNPPEVTHAT